MKSSIKKYPTKKECLEFYKELNTPENIIKHVLKVNKIAVYLAKKIKEKGYKINVKLVDKASLLHDLDKWLCINNKELKHGFETEKILAKKGYPEIGYYAKQHIADLLIEKPTTIEEKVICYADNRVLGDKIVPLMDRREYIEKKYKKNKDEEEKIREEIKKIEKEIFELAGINELPFK